MKREQIIAFFDNKYLNNNNLDILKQTNTIQFLCIKIIILVAKQKSSTQKNFTSWYIIELLDNTCICAIYVDYLYICYQSNLVPIGKLYRSVGSLFYFTY